MKFSATLVSFALFFAGSVEGHAHIGKLHRRGGASATFTPTPASTTATSVATTTSTASGVSKRGVSYNEIQAVQQFSDKIVWMYNWASVPGGDIPAGKKFYPMLWGADAGHTNSWNEDATAAIAAGADTLLGFNEPDLGAQSNLSPQAAASAWKEFMEPFAGKAKLCSPAITNGGAPMGTAWLDGFMSECSDCTIDCIAFHIYDSATNIDYFKNYITDIGTKYGKPTLMTEFGASGSTADQQTFLNTMLPFLDSLDTVEGYAYFMAGQDILVDGGNNLLPLGQTYNTVA